jgi:excisionase family DNA binding protein
MQTKTRARMIRVREAAEILGVSSQIVYRAVWDGTIPAVYVSPKALRISEADVRKLSKTWNPPGYVDAEEVAERLGVSVRTVWRYAADGDITSERDRGRLRFRDRDVERLIRNGRTRRS